MNDRHLADMDWRAALRQCLHKQKKSFTGELKQLSIQLKTLSEDSPEYQELLKRAEELRKQKICVTVMHHRLQSDHRCENTR